MNGQQKLKTAGGAFLAIVELLVLFLGTAILAREAANALELDSYRAVSETWSEGDDVPWMRLAIHDSIRHGLRYIPLFLVAFAWGYFIFKFVPRDYGLTLAEKPIWKHIAWGVGLFVVVGLPVKIVLPYLQDAGMGEGAPHWAMIESGSGVGFWMFMAASSFILPPILEELFFRGYAQTRLAKPIGVVPAVIVIATLFTAAHTQYHSLEITSLFMIAALLIGATANGLVRHWTGSLIAPIVAHVLANIPW